MTTEDLIVRLARDAGPVAVLPSPASRLLRWVAIVALVCAAAIAAIGLRADFGPMLGRAWFATEGGLVLAAALAAAAAALVSSVPGLAHARALTSAALAFGVAWIGATIWRLAAAGAPIDLLVAEPLHPACLVRIAAIGAVPALALGAMVRLGAPLAPASAGALVALGGFAAAAAVVHAACPINAAAHAVIWHAGPVAALVAIGAATGRGYAVRTEARV